MSMNKKQQNEYAKIYFELNCFFRGLGGKMSVKNSDWLTVDCHLISKRQHSVVKRWSTTIILLDFINFLAKLSGRKYILGPLLF